MLPAVLKKWSLAVLSMLAALPPTALAPISPAAAGNGYDPNYRYCMQGSVSPSGPDVADCAFNTYEQCMMAASGYGYCIDNPVYTGTTAPRPRTRRR